MTEPTAETKQPAEGWTWLANAPKWHYFVGGHSLCGNWLYLGKDADLEQGNDSSPDNCKACQRKLAARRAAAEKAAAKAKE